MASGCILNKVMVLRVYIYIYIKSDKKKSVFVLFNSLYKLKHIIKRFYDRITIFTC